MESLIVRIKTKAANMFWKCLFSCLRMRLRPNLLDKMGVNLIRYIFLAGHDLDFLPVSTADLLHCRYPNIL
jgi:hypothetical protein